MNKLNNDTLSNTYAIAEQAMQQCANGLLSVDTLVTQMYQELAKEERQCDGTAMLSSKLLKRTAQRICSRALCEAWLSNDESLRNRAFENIRRYLKESLLHSTYAQRVQGRVHALEDVLHQTMEVLYVLARKKLPTGPDDPAAFLKWTQTILVRQTHVFLEYSEHDTHISLEQQEEYFAEQFVDTRNGDPLDEVLRRETRAILGKALLSLRNPKYYQVLLATYILNLDEQVIAQQLQVSVQYVYLWRHRALKALRKQPEVIKILHPL